MAKVTFEANAKQVAQWLQIAKNQRERMYKKFQEDFGADSPATLAIRHEVDDISATITALLKQIASS